MAQVKLGEKWRYALENNFVHDSKLPRDRPGGPAWGLTNYLFYDINDCWGFGLRDEYLEDLDGVSVFQIGPPFALEPGSQVERPDGRAGTGSPTRTSPCGARSAGTGLKTRPLRATSPSTTATATASSCGVNY